MGGALAFAYLPGKLSLKELEGFNKEESEFCCCKVGYENNSPEN